MGYAAREALFISHASPEDNAFSLWLGAKLTALGYEVFADVLRLRGGDDWERILEAPFAIRPPSFSWLQHLTGCRSRVYDQFIVPLRLAPFDAPLQIAHAQYDFFKGWALGLSELLSLLTELEIPRARGAANAGLWRGVQLKDARPITASADRCARHAQARGARSCGQNPDRRG